MSKRPRGGEGAEERGEGGGADDSSSKRKRDSGAPSQDGNGGDGASQGVAAPGASLTRISDNFDAEHGQRMLAVEIAYVLGIVQDHINTVTAEQNTAGHLAQLFNPVQRLFHEVLKRYDLKEQFDEINAEKGSKNTLHFPLEQLRELQRMITLFVNQIKIHVANEAHWLSPPNRRKQPEDVIDEEYETFTSKMKIISIFNNKGGVSKTTTVAGLGYALAQMGKRVLVVDLDAQMNLSQLLLTDDQLERIGRDSRPEAPQHIGDALYPAFTDGSNLRPKPVLLQKRFSFRNQGCLFLLPGNFEVDQFESWLCEAYNSRGASRSDSLGCLNRVLQLTEMLYHRFDYCLLDLSPSIRELNQNALMTSDFFITPCSPDVFSAKAIVRLSEIVPKWREKHSFLQQFPPDRGFAYPLSHRTPKFLGSTVLRFSQRNMMPSLVVRLFCRRIELEVQQHMIVKLTPLNMALDEAQYRTPGATGEQLGEDYHCICKLHDFNRAAQLSHYYKVPVNGLCEEHLTQPTSIDSGFEVHQPLKGTHRSQLEDQIVKIQRVFVGMAERVERLVTSTGVQAPANP